MHELSLMEGVLEIVLDAQREQGFRRVTRITLEVGALAGVEPEALRFCCEAVTADSVAEGAVLDLVEIPAMAACASCGAEFPLESRADPCPRCGGGPGRFLSGLELQVKALEVDF